MNVKILAFGQIAEITGQSESIVTAKDTDGLRLRLTEQFSALKATQFAMAVNKKVISENTVLNDGDTVALLPPFSGG